LGAIATDRFSRLAALKPAKKKRTAGAFEEPRGTVPDLPLGSLRLAEILGAMPNRNRFGEHLALRRWFSEAIGCEPPERIDADTIALLAPDAPRDAADPTQWLFLDTETTGLAGGTGTYPFLVGIAWWDAGGLEIEQFFMRDHSEEHSLLVALAQRMAEKRVLVTFNGKTFDWPLLETRFRMTRAIRAPTPRAHLDFLHPARNLWRLRLGSARLPELERHVLGWDRGADVISEFIPTIYFDFLRGGPAEPLIPIFYHNQMDLRGLAGVAARVVSLLGNLESRGTDGLELFGVSRICERRGRWARARELYSQSLALELPDAAGRLAKKALARLAKRDGEFALACEVWNTMLDGSREGIEAYEALAIHYERRARQPHNAAMLVRKALAELRRAHRLGTLAPAFRNRLRARFEARLARLERKLRSTLPAGCGVASPESNTRAGESNLEAED
jgi:uncharacterized protein